MQGAEEADTLRDRALMSSQRQAVGQRTITHALFWGLVGNSLLRNAQLKNKKIKKERNRKKEPSHKALIR